MRLLLSIVLVLAMILSCYTEDIYLRLWPPRPGKAVFLTLRAHRMFNFDQEKAFGGKRNVALSQYIPLYTFLPDRVSSADKKMDDLINDVAAFQSREPPDSTGFSKYIKKEFAINIDPGIAARILGYSNLKNLLEAIRTLEQPLQQGKIVEDTEPIKGKKNVEVLYPDPVGTVAYVADEFMTLEQARRNLEQKIRQLLWQVDKENLDTAVQLALSVLQPDLKYDQKENERRIKEISRRYPSKIVPYKAGEILVPFGKILSEEDALLLEANRAQEMKQIYERAPRLFLSIILSVIFYILLLSESRRKKRRPPYGLLLSLLIISVVLLKACLLFTPVSVYGLPVAFLPLSLLLVFPDKTAVAWTTLLEALLVCLFSGSNLDLMFFFSLEGIAAILLYPQVRKWFHVLRPSLAIAFLNAAIVSFLLLDWSVVASLLKGTDSMSGALLGRIFTVPLLTRAGWAFAGGFLAGPLALLLLPVLEFGWGTVSAFKLSNYTDLQHPLLRDLLVKAPGTYQHTMTVAYLAQAAGEAVGANTLLLRAGAYFHDIGKTAAPGYFIENQSAGRNPHDELDPSLSCKIIMEHVEKGRKIAAKAGLPDLVQDFIPQHHGTLLIEYFYDKARKAGRDNNKILEEEFRYPGPKPQSIEAALLMIVDAVEAASRTLADPNRDKIEAMIRFIIERRIADGQFDECDLSTRDVGKIVDTLAGFLEAVYHSRIEYPWQKREDHLAAEL